MSDGKGFTEKLKSRLQDEFLQIERNPTLSADEKVKKLIFTTSALCAGIAVQPIPFADMPILTSIQGFMGWKIATVREVNLAEEGVLPVLKYVGSVIGAGLAAQHFVIALWKMGLPGAGGLMTIPVVFGITYGIGRAMDVYFCAKRDGRVPTPEEIKRAFKLGKLEGKRDGEAEHARRAASGRS